MALHIRSAGLALASRAIEGDDAAALELCRARDDLSLPKLIGEFFEGKLTTALFDLLADSHAQACEERELDAKMGGAA